MDTAGKHSKRIEVDVGVVEEPLDFLDYVKIKRGLEAKDCHARISKDSGKDFYKIGMNVLDKSKEKEKPFFGDEFKDTGVKRLTLLGAAENVKESYENVRDLYNECQIEKFQGTPHTYTGDQKILSIMCGKPNSNCKFPCCYCNAETPYGFKEDGDLYELGYLQEQNREYVFAGSPSLRQRDYENVVNYPIFAGPPSQNIIDMFPPSVLHLMLRVINHICDDLTNKTKKRFRKDIVLEFAKENAIVRKSYHGGNYQGNQCRSIMRKVDRLEAKLPGDLKVY